MHHSSTVSQVQSKSSPRTIGRTGDPARQYCYAAGDDGIFEDVVDTVRIVFDLRHVFRFCVAQLVFCPARNARFNGEFQIAIKPFIGIQLRRVTGQIENFDLLHVFSQPLLDRLARMYAQVVEYPKDLTPGLLDQSLKELDQAHMAEVALRFGLRADDRAAGASQAGVPVGAG